MTLGTRLIVGLAVTAAAFLTGGTAVADEHWPVGGHGHAPEARLLDEHSPVAGDEHSPVVVRGALPVRGMW